jgi:V/A-type H+-transporting ATPase subunit C
MEGFEYGNARLRAMRSHLLSPGEIIRMTEVRDLAELISILIKTPYQRSLEITLALTNDLDGIFEALRRNFIDSIAGICSFYQENERRLVDLLLTTYDLHNLKTVLRGLSHHSTSAEIEASLLPVGKMSEIMLGQLLHASSPREAVDILATISHPLAQPLLILRAEHPGADLSEMELALDRWRFSEISRFAKEQPDGSASILATLHLETDLFNLLAVLRFVQAPNERQVIKTYLEKNSFAALFPGLGAVSIECLKQAYTARNIKSAVALLMDAGPTWAQALEAGLRVYEQTNRLSEIEKSLRRHQLRWHSWQIAKDPLGIGVVIGYLALKTNEINNLRRIARGIQLRLAPAVLQAELELIE